ncbi:hypothetical protein BGZ72_008100 [Mortierella alpina]|nr:hypothetical protein BGZ72_008100 [Mortierella alpina]
MKITNVILALSAVVALAQAQQIPKTGVAAVDGAVDQAKNTVGGLTTGATGGLPGRFTAMRRRQVPIVDNTKNLAGQAIKDVTGALPAGTMPTLPVNKRDVAGDYVGKVKEGIEKSVSGLENAAKNLVKQAEGKLGELKDPKVPAGIDVPTALPTKRGLDTVLPLNVADCVPQIKAIQTNLETALVGQIKKTLDAEVGKTVDFSKTLRIEIVHTVTSTVQSNIDGLLKLDFSGLTVDSLKQLIDSAVEHTCAELVPKLNAVFAKVEETKAIVLTAAGLADPTLAELKPKVDNILNGLQPKVDETVGNVKNKVDETVENVKGKAGETVENVKGKAGETVGNVKNTVDEVKSKVPAEIPAVVPADVPAL